MSDFMAFEQGLWILYYGGDRDDNEWGDTHVMNVANGTLFRERNDKLKTLAMCFVPGIEAGEDHEGNTITRQIGGEQ